jgi:hypothetical protein
MISGIIQTFLLNGPSTNKEGCEISFLHCWSWGLSINQYYGLMFSLIACCFIPICYLHEPDASTIPQHSLMTFVTDIWSDEEFDYLVSYYIGYWCRLFD